VEARGAGLGVDGVREVLFTTRPEELDGGRLFPDELRGEEEEFRGFWAWRVATREQASK